jgi:hypothetical protein
LYSLYKVRDSRVAPFQRLVDAHVGEWREGCDVGWLFDLLSQNRDLVVALLAAQAHEIDLSDNPELTGALDPLHMAAEIELAVRNGDDVDVQAPVPVTFAMVFALAVFDAWLFSPNERPSRDQIVGEITHCLRGGLSHRERSA